MTNRELATAMGLGLTSVRTKCYELGLLRMKMEYWTEEQVNYLLENYKQKGDVELAEEFNNKWHKEKGWTKKHIEKKRRYLHLKRTKKEIHLIALRNIEAGRFSVNHWKRWYGRASKIGTIKTWINRESDSQFKVIKTKDGYKHLNRYLWERENGPIEPGFQITYKDGNPLNCVIENLEKLPVGNHPSFLNASIELSDGYIAGVMSHNDPELRDHLINLPDLLEIKRQQLILQRTINEHGKQL
ncbi:HNH endonuclease signature motif containing protein [Roseivirga seohaensis]|uniref:HNH endonuclease signature motif containing protein n=1 Tax=Roseivirga seohaensis TaxID=1914963 RepID=UPI003BA8F483